MLVFVPAAPLPSQAGPIASMAPPTLVDWDSLRWEGRGGRGQGLDNLPSETQHILAEIRHRDVRTHGASARHLLRLGGANIWVLLMQSRPFTPSVLDWLPVPPDRLSVLDPPPGGIIGISSYGTLERSQLQQEVQKETSRYIRHSTKLGAGTTTPTPLSAKDSALPQTISAHYAEIDQLAGEKEALARRLVQLIERARARLDHDLNKVLVLQGDLDPAAQVVLSGVAAVGGGTRNAAEKINESLRNAIAIPEAPIVSVVSPAPPPTKSACWSVFVLIEDVLTAGGKTIMWDAYR
ncbi:uncharacterized protein FIBRA_00235 [Fibroporia radiculosa]|uniref:Inhibitor of growth protein N-terminal histone-binding domain-containing protein n=1 Tax=Fibroporia radiculosa TaxID=599839 RepID=J7SBY7_9APHY|nr:uncharacterized protein FIBRA_00235 [Fibroporia radiculosa]CCL98241.1 predicted protein [Fibroporia radiculosa]